MRLMPLGTIVLAGAAVAAAPTPVPRPEFPPITLSDLTGQSFQLKDFLGTVTVLNFWATWCGPCRVEMPELQKLANDLGARGLVVLAINVDLPANPEEIDMAQLLRVLRPRIEGFLAQSGVSLPVYLVDARTQVGLGVDRIPFSVLLDREGRVVRVYAGYSPDSMADLRKQALGVLGQQGKQGKQGGK